jgi:hypothetical protein
VRRRQYRRRQTRNGRHSPRRPVNLYAFPAVSQTVKRLAFACSTLMPSASDPLARSLRPRPDSHLERNGRLPAAPGMAAWLSSTLSEMPALTRGLNASGWSQNSSCPHRSKGRRLPAFLRRVGRRTLARLRMDYRSQITGFTSPRRRLRRATRAPDDAEPNPTAARAPDHVRGEKL